MSETPGYWRDPYQVDLETEVVETGTDPEGRPWAILADTILYPEGGGQPCDLGSINDVPVTGVLRGRGRVIHLLDRAQILGPARVRLDWDRRYDHMQQHTAQHLLTAVAEDHFGWPTTAFHLGSEVSDVELDVSRIAEKELRDLEGAVAAGVRGALAVGERRTTVGDMAAVGARCRGLPEGLDGEIRLVEIQGVDLAACGGTHLRSTAEIECVCLLDTEALRGGTRVHFVAGGRVRRRMARHETRNAALRALLGAPDEELTTAAAAKLEQLQAVGRAQKRLTADLGAAIARALASSDEAVVAYHLAVGGQELLQAVARQLTSLGFTGLALLTSGSGHFALVSGDETPRLPELGRTGGRGAGRTGRRRGTSVPGQDRRDPQAPRGARDAALRDCEPQRGSSRRRRMRASSR